jgi:uncharacterized protein (DUF1501 family)
MAKAKKFTANTNIGNQLTQVVRVIKKRSDLNDNCQIFFVELNGFDTHQNQLSSQGHSGLLAQVGFPK